jgi:hypothetical protein
VRRLAALVAIVASLAALAGTARADNASDAGAVADKFVVALLSNDGATACSLPSRRALDALGGKDKCPARFAPESS